MIIDEAEAEGVIAEAKDDITEILAQVSDYIHRQTHLPWGAWDRADIAKIGSAVEKMIDAKIAIALGRYQP